MFHHWVFLICLVSIMYCCIILCSYKLVTRSYQLREQREQYEEESDDNYGGVVLADWMSLGRMDFLERPLESWWSEDVPRIIHQLAPADHSKWHNAWFGCHNTWKTIYPEGKWMHIMWTDEEMDLFVKNMYRDFYDRVYSKYDKLIKKIDVVRYLILYHFGGLYADMDYECVADFWDMLKKGKASVAESAHEGEGYQNALMASPPRHPFWHYVLYEVMTAIPEPEVLYSTGPNSILRAASVAPASMLNSLPAEQFSVYGFNEVIHTKSEHEQSFVPTVRQGVYAAHHGTGMWEP